MKENDILLNMLANPYFSVGDFQSAGLTAENTGLRPEEDYKKSEKILQNPYFQDVNGKFDEAKFHNFYIAADDFYNQLATKDYNTAIMESVQFSKDNIWVEPEKRTIDYAPRLVREPNETLVSNSLYRVGKKGPRTLSTSEIAQTQKVHNTKTGEWTDSPNDSFFDNFFDTLVLATYDNDEFDENGNLIHQKGERKLNDEGLPYYETLGGRDVYGKQVLNKMNILTTDGSFANKFDFFDSDDIEQKSWAGSILKNAALVGSMFIPYVGPVITGLSVGTQMTGLLATIGKLVVGNENELLNDIQGWAKTVNRSAQTEYAAENTWCGENFFNMIGDTIGQLKEQRWIFNTLPAIIKGNKKYYDIMTTKGRNQFINKQVEKLDSKLLTKNVEEFTDTDLRQIINQAANGISYDMYREAVHQMNIGKATKLADDLMKQVTKIGSPLSKAYMTGITVQDTYGEAKQAGASDLEAALLTIGYAAGEAAILNTEIGQWILPEARVDKFRYKAIAKALTKDVKEAYDKYAVDSSKKNFVQSILNTGKKIAEADYSSASKTVLAHAMAEATEEVSEELLADFSKSAFNVYRWLANEESLDLGEWENMFDRYSMSALGGFIGGGITSAGTDFVVSKNLANMNKSTAMQELLYIVNNNQDGEFLRAINKMNLGNKNLSTEFVSDKYKELYKPADKYEDSQDYAVKQIIKGEVTTIRDILTKEGAKLSTDSLLRRLSGEDQQEVLKNIRTASLANASTMGIYTQAYQNIQANLVSLNSKIREIENKFTDGQKMDRESEEQIAKIQEELKVEREKLNRYISGEVVPEAVADAIFEANPFLSRTFVSVSLPDFVRHKYNKEYNELNESQKKEALNSYKEWRNTGGKNDIHLARVMYHDFMLNSSPVILKQQEFLKNLEKSESNLSIENAVTQFFNTLVFLDPSEDTYTETAQQLLGDEGRRFIPILSKYVSQEQKDNLKKIATDLEGVTKQLEETPKDDPNYESLQQSKQLLTAKQVLSYQLYLQDSIDVILNDIIKVGYISPTFKQSVVKFIDSYISDLNKFIVDENGYPSVQLEIIYGDDLSLQDKRAQQATITNTVTALRNYKQQILEMRNTPIIEFLDQYKLSVSDSDLNLTKHLQDTEAVLQNNINDLESFGLDSTWEENNKEAIQVIDSYIAVLNGMKVDNADINNPTGYSRIINNINKAHNIKGYQELAEIDSSTADSLVSELLRIKNRLLFASRLNAVNQGQKLTEQERVGDVKNKLVYSNFKSFVQTIADNDKFVAKEAIDKLNNTLQEISALEDLSTKDRWDRNDRLEAETAIVKMDNAIYDFFQEVKLTKEQLGNILRNFAGEQGFFEQTGDLLTTGSTSLSKNTFIWYLASRAAMKSSDFLHYYKQALSDKIAPIPGQEMAVYLGVASIVNSDVMNDFVEAYHSTAVEQFNNMDEAKRAEVLNKFDESGNAFSKDLLEYFAGHNVLPQYKNIVFIEGAPGTGKTNAVFPTIKAVIDKIDDKYLENVMLVHTDSAKAKEAMDKIGLKGEAKSQEELLKWMSSDWKDTRNNNNTFYDGTYKFENGRLVNIMTLNKYDKVPKVIFIDEIGQYDQNDLDLISRFAQENGIVVITAGDVHQNVKTTKATVKGKTLDFTISRNNFARSMKLGVPLRTTTKQMSNSLKHMQTAWNNIKGTDNPVEFEYFNGDEEHKGLYGVRSFSNSSNVDDIVAQVQLMVDTTSEKIGYIYYDKNSEIYKALTSKFGDKLKLQTPLEAQGEELQYYIVESAPYGADSQSAKVEKFRELYTGVSRAKQGAILISSQQIGSITLSEKADNKYQKEILNEAGIKKSYQRRIELLEEVLAEFEGDSHNIEIKQPSKPSIQTQTTLDPPPPTLSPGSFADRTTAEIKLEEFKKKGDNLIVVDKDGKEFDITDYSIEESTENGIQTFTPTATIEGNKMPLEQLLKEYSIKNKDNTIVPKYNEGDKLVIDTGNVVITKVDDKNYTVTNLDGNNEQIISLEDLHNRFKDYYKEPDPEPEYDTPPSIMGNTGTLQDRVEDVTDNNIKDEPRRTTNRNDVVQINHLLYTFNTFAPGIVEENGNPKFDGPQEKFDARIDNGVGLMKLFPTWDYKSIIETLAKLNNAFKDGDITTIRDILHLKNTDVINIRYGIKSTAGRLDGNKKLFNRFDQSENEKALFIESDDTDADRKMRKTLSALIFINGVPKLELSLASINSPLTLMYLDDFNKVGEFFDSETKGTNTYDKINEVITQFGNDPYYSDLIDLFKFWKFTSNGWFMLPEGFKLETKLGPQLLKEKGQNQVDGSYQYNFKLTDIEEFAKNPQFHISSVFLSKDGYNGHINTAHPFVLISDSNKYKTDDELVEQWRIQQNPNYSGRKSVSLVYVIPPHAKASDWIINQENLYQNAAGQNNPIYDLGNDFTAYRILQALQKSGKFDSFQSLDGLKPEVLKLLDELNKIEENLSQQNPVFDNTVMINGQTQGDFYKSELRKSGEKRARYNTIYLTQKQVLDRPITTSSPDITKGHNNRQLLSKYVTSIVYLRGFRKKEEEALLHSDNQIQKLLSDLDEALGEDFMVFFKPKYSEQNVGPFAKVRTTDKYSIKTPSGINSQFQINAKVTTSVFQSEDLHKYIHEFLKDIYFDGRVWKIKDPSTTYTEQGKYLEVDTPKEPIVSEKLMTRYKSYFDKAYLDVSVIDNNLPELDNLNRLASQFMKTKGRFAYIDNNGQLMLFQDTNINYVIKPDQSQTITDTDVYHNYQIVFQDGTTGEVQIKVEQDGSVIIQSSNQNRVYGSITINNYQEIQEIIRQKIDNLPNMSKSRYRSIINNSLDELISKLKDGVISLENLIKRGKSDNILSEEDIKKFEELQNMYYSVGEDTENNTLNCNNITLRKL